MKLAAVICAILLISTLAFWFFRRTRSSESETFSFQEVLKDRGKRQQLIEEMNPPNLDQLTDDELQRLVEAYVKTQHQSPEYWAVRRLKKRAAPYLIEVLKRPESFIKPAPHGILDDESRHRQLENFSERQDKILDSATEEWFAEHKDISTLVYLYALRHRADFVPVDDRPPR